MEKKVNKLSKSSHDLAIAGHPQVLMLNCHDQSARNDVKGKRHNSITSDNGFLRMCNFCFNRLLNKQYPPLTPTSLRAQDCKRVTQLVANDPQSHSHKAFTLAEVLITIGIIGIVAAMTLPSLINDKKNKELETRFKKVYSVMQQALLKMSFEEGMEINSENYTNPTEFLSKFRTYFVQYVPCTKNRCDGLSANEAISKLQKIYSTYNGKSNIDVYYFDDTSTIMTDGIEIMTNGGYSEFGINLTVDINGQQAKPNQWGKDLFTFQMINGKLLPMGAEGTEYYGRKLTPETYCNNKIISPYNGATCASKALSDSDFFKNFP